MTWKWLDVYYSDENMMDPYNLAICFGPTLVPVPDHKDQVQYQNLVNELIKNFIIFHEDIFPTNVPGNSISTPSSDLCWVIFMYISWTRLNWSKPEELKTT